MVRAKFVIRSKEVSIGYAPAADGSGNWEPCEVVTVKAWPVYGNGDPNHENTKFWSATPSGEITLGVIPKPAADFFELGKEYYVDFTPAD